MSFLAILLALMIEQARPLASSNWVHHGVRVWVRWCAKSFDGGRPAHAWLTWSFATLVPTLGVLLVQVVLMKTIGWAAAVAWNVMILYMTLGFRQFSHHFTGIRDALEAGDEVQARNLLAQWQRLPVDELPRSEIVRLVIVQSVLAAHRHVFGVLAWYTVLAALGLGPAGAVFYRFSGFAVRYWQQSEAVSSQPVSHTLQHVSQSAWHLVDWLPARITALGFAIVGSFEEAVDGWRQLTQRTSADNHQGISNDAVILAATAGALNLNLKSGMDAHSQVIPERRATPRAGQTPVLSHLRAIVGLVWRTVVMWMLLLALLTLARLLG